MSDKSKYSSEDKDMGEKEIKRFIIKNFQAVYERVSLVDEPDAEGILNYFLTFRPLVVDLADVVKANVPGYGDIALSEEAFNGKIEKIEYEQDITIFNQVLNNFLANYALTVMVDGKDIIQGLMPEVVSDNDILLADDNRERLKDFR